MPRQPIAKVPKGKRIAGAKPRLPKFTEVDLRHALRRGKPRMVSIGKARGKEVE